MPSSEAQPDVIGIKPRLKEVKLRLERGGAPSGIAYLLLDNEWKSTQTMVEKTGLEAGFVTAVLRDSELDGWVKSRVNSDGTVWWKVDAYRVPAEECVMMCCGAEDPLGALDVLETLKGCFHRGYLLFPYQVEGKFLDGCWQRDIGVLVFDGRIASFTEALPAKHLKVENLKVYASLCEKMVVDNCAFRTGQLW